MLTALHEATLAIADGISLPRTLQRIADTARVIVKTKFAALGVIEAEGGQYVLKQFITSGLSANAVRKIAHEPIGRGLLGDIFTSDGPINVKNIHEDPRATGFVSGHPVMTTFLGVPIKYRGKQLGNLYLCDRLDGQPFDDNDEQMISLLASHAAIAIENARLHEELQTIALRSERDRIGMELHDGVIQSIYAVGMKLEILRIHFEFSSEHERQYQSILSDLNQIIEDIRSYIRNLLSARDEQATLKQKIENLVAHFQDFSGVHVNVNVADELPLLTDIQRHNMMQILREALANVAKHAHASKVDLTITEKEKEIRLVVSDDGKGFDPIIIDSERSQFGLRNMEQRARRINSRLQIQSNPGIGTTIILQIPTSLGFS
ncbi:MAG: GAF domain-containing sensor histidine kinase [Anaerolineae bacterium]|nr:GAF domain-containing sensor histidine kinase [Anaerolineae bacterium]